MIAGRLGRAGRPGREREPGAPGTPGARITTEPAAWVPLLLLAGVWSWWAIKQGAFFGSVLYPGIVLLALGLLLLLAVAPWRARLGLSPGMALGGACLIGLGAWYALSALWSPAPDIAVAGGQRTLGYALALGLGVWLCVLLGSRTHLAMAPLALAGLLAGGASIVVLLSGDDPGRYLEVDGTLDYPLGYRNANAAFFLIALWPALGLATERSLDWRLRGLALGTTTLCIELALLSQSRGSVLGAGAALAVYLALTPHRARALLWLLLAAAPAPAVLAAVGALRDAVNADAPLALIVEEMGGAGRAVALTTAVAALAGALAARLEPRAVAAAARTGIGWNRAAGGLLVATVVAGALAFVIEFGDPVEFVEDRVLEFREEGTPSLGDRSTRFTLHAGSSRADLWRIALEAARDSPLVGEGAGGYRFRYTRERTSSERYARDAHSVGLEVLSELGAVGLVLLVGAVGGLTAGAVRSRRLGPGASTLSAVALAAGAYWLVHASLDWFWPYAALSAPVIALLGSAGAPALRSPDRRAAGWARISTAVLAAALALSVIPPLLSDRYVSIAYREWRAEPAAAFRDLDRARKLNPLSDAPLLAEGVIARAAGDRPRAIRAFHRARELRPEEWASSYYLALLYRRTDPELARQELARVRELDPLGPRLDALERRVKGP